MKARIKATEEIVEVSMECNNSTDYRKAIFRTKDGMCYRYNDFDIATENAHALVEKMKEERK